MHRSGKEEGEKGYNSHHADVISFLATNSLKELTKMQERMQPRLLQMQH